MTQRQAPERDDSLVFWLFALVGLFAAGVLVAHLVGHHIPMVWIVMAGATSWAGLFMSLGHIYDMVQRVRKAGRS
jgi:hypothetical protein